MINKAPLFSIFLHLSASYLFIQPSFSNENATTISSSPCKSLRQGQLDLREEEKTQGLLIESSSKLPATEVLFPETVTWEMIESAKKGKFADQEKILMKALSLRWEPETLKGRMQIANWKVNPSYIHHPLMIMRDIILSESKNRAEEIERLLELQIAFSNSSPLLPFYQFVYGYCKLIRGRFFEAYEFLNKAADQGNALAHLKLGQAFRENLWGRNPEHQLKAREYLTKAADQGIALACYYLWYMWKKGEGGPQDMDKALDYLERGAQLGYAEAQSKLGRALLTGKYGKEDPVKGQEWLERAAKQGSASALKHFFLNPYEGLEEPKNKAKAWQWLEKIAGQPNSSVLLLSIANEIWPKGSKSKVGIVKCFLKAIRHGNNELLSDLHSRLEKIKFLGEGKHVSNIMQVVFEAAEQGDLEAKRQFKYLFYPVVLKKGTRFKKFVSDMGNTLDKVDNFCETEGKWLAQYTSSPLIQASGMQDVFYNPREEEFFSRNVEFAISLKEIIEHLGHPEMYPEGEERQHFLTNVKPGFMVNFSLHQGEGSPPKAIFYKKTEKQKPQFLRYYPKFKVYCLGEESVRLGDALMEMFDKTASQRTHSFQSYKEIMGERLWREGNNIKLQLVERKAIKDRIKSIKEILQKEEGIEQQKILTEKLESLSFDREINSQYLETVKEKINQIPIQLKDIDSIKTEVIDLINKFSSIRNDYLLTTYPWLKGNF